MTFCPIGDQTPPLLMIVLTTILGCFIQMLSRLCKWTSFHGSDLCRFSASRNSMKMMKQQATQRTSRQLASEFEMIATWVENYWSKWQSYPNRGRSKTCSKPTPNCSRDKKKVCSKSLWCFCAVTRSRDRINGQESTSVSHFFTSSWCCLVSSDTAIQLSCVTAFMSWSSQLGHIVPTLGWNGFSKLQLPRLVNSIDKGQSLLSSQLYMLPVACPFPRRGAAPWGGLFRKPKLLNARSELQVQNDWILNSRCSELKKLG